MLWCALQCVFVLYVCVYDIWCCVVWCECRYRRSTLKLYRNCQRRLYELRVASNDFDYDMMMNNKTSADSSSMNSMSSMGSMGSMGNMGSTADGAGQPLLIKFELNSSIYFSTVSSLALGLVSSQSDTGMEQVS